MFVEKRRSRKKLAGRTPVGAYLSMRRCRGKRRSDRLANLNDRLSKRRRPINAIPSEMSFLDSEIMNGKKKFLGNRQSMQLEVEIWSSDCHSQSGAKILIGIRVQVCQPIRAGHRRIGGSVAAISRERQPPRRNSWQRSKSGSGVMGSKRKQGPASPPSSYFTTTVLRRTLLPLQAT